MSAGVRVGITAQTRWLAVSALLVAALVFGGATKQGHLSDVVLQAVSVPFLIWGIAAVGSARGGGTVAAFIAIGLLCVLLPALQLVPFLSGAASGPARLLSQEIGQLAGHEASAVPVSTAPRVTLLAALSLIPAMAVFLGTLQLSLRERRRLVLALLLVGVLSVFLGLLQVANGPTSPLRPYAITNPLDAVGFFANRNHFAALVYCLLLFTGAWALFALRRFAAAPVAERFDAGYILPAVLSLTFIIVLIAAQFFTRSRAGLLLMLAALGFIAIAAIRTSGADRSDASTSVKAGRLVAAAVVVGILISAPFAFYRIADRLDLALGQDARFPFTVTTLIAAWAHFPFGTGFGTFMPVYAFFEKPAVAMLDVFANRAHNDFAEVGLEAGLPGVLIFIGFAACLVVALRQRWATASGPLDIDGAIARAAGVAIVLVLVHSALDYPLRTAALQCVFAMCCALLLPAPHSQHDAAEAARPNERRREAKPEKPARSPRAPASPSRLGAQWPLEPRTSEEPRQPAAGPASIRGDRWGSEIEWPSEWQGKSPDALGAPTGTRSDKPRGMRSERED